MVTVLIVDDEPEIAEILAEELQRHGFATRQTHNGRDAFGLICAGGIDAVLSDVRMPGGDGIELLAKIRLKGLTLPFAFISAFADLTRQRATNLGAQALFQKPYELDDLVTFLRKALSRTPPSAAKP